jgi:hypothetical protein
MRAFIFACLAAALLAGGAAVILNNGLVPNSAESVFVTPGVRI